MNTNSQSLEYFWFDNDDRKAVKCDDYIRRERGIEHCKEVSQDRNRFARRIPTIAISFNLIFITFFIF